jgi:prolipoprotein diacylglyceryltransferase
VTFSISDIADALRWLWFACSIFWLAYSWLHRIEYRRTLLGIIGLVALDWLLHAFADYAEEPGSNLPSDFARYSVIMLLAASVGLSAAFLYARWRGLKDMTVIDAALVCVIAGGIAGRAYHVWMNWNYYSENRDFITDLAQGGFGIRGAIIFVYLALAAFAWVTNNSVWQLGDAAVIGLSIAQSIGWYGAYLTHTHYGIALDTPASAAPFAPLAQIIRAFGYNFVQALPDAYNLIAFRIPVQILAALFFLGVWLALLNIARARRNPPGYPLTWYLLLASAANFIFGFWRGDETLLWNGLRVDQWLDLVLFVIGLALAGGRILSRLQRGRANFSERRILQQT